jgi:glycosyltransferase involved in cell wall biosynthesis
MRVLHFYKTAFPDTMGGVEQVINQIARGSTRLGVTTEVLSLTPDRLARTVEIDGYLAHRARLDLQIASTGFSVSAFLRFSQLARQADVIHYHFPWPFMDLVHFATRVNKPSVVTYHSDIIRQKHLLTLYRPLKRRFLSSVDRIVATSPNYLATSDVLSRFPDKVRVIPIGLDKQSYPAIDPERMRYWRSRFGERFFLFVGVIRYYKGLHILIEAARGSSYPIVIVGAGPIEDELKKQAASLGVTNIHFLGHLPDPDKVALLTLCHAVVFPSHLRSEAFGVSLLEGAMYGKPLISSEIGTGTTFINIGGETGIVVPPGDPQALRGAMDALWQDDALAARMGCKAEERYWNHFTAEQMAHSYVNLYRELAPGAT